MGKLSRLAAGMLKRLPAVILIVSAGLAAHSQCRSVTFTAELQSGQSFRQKLGNGLTFLLRPSPEPTDPEGYPEQWTIEIHAAQSYKDLLDAENPDFIYPVNPPLRGNPAQSLGAVYGLSIKQSLEQPRDLFFLLSRQDFDRMTPILSHALWPYTSRDPDKTTGQYFTALSKLKLGELKFKILHYQLGEPVVRNAPENASPENASDDGRKTPEDRIITAIQFEAEVTVPAGFALQPGLKSRPATCSRVKSF
jgi:hypothetical protein